MDNTNQISTIEKIIELENMVDNLENEVITLDNAQFRPKPLPPITNYVKSHYPPINPKVEYNPVVVWLMPIAAALIFLPSLLFTIPYVQKYKDQKLEECVNRIRNSEIYRAECAQIDARDAEQNRLLKEQYESDTKEYEETILPNWESEFSEWENDRTSRLDAATKELSIKRKELDDLYNTSKLVPAQYRDIDILTYILETMQSSDYDVKAAIEVYDRNAQMALEEERLREQQIANMRASEQNQLLREQNNLVAESNAIADQARFEANAAAVVSAIQHHNTNKYLKNR